MERCHHLLRGTDAGSARRLPVLLAAGQAGISIGGSWWPPYRLRNSLGGIRNSEGSPSSPICLDSLANYELMTGCVSSSIGCDWQRCLARPGSAAPRIRTWPSDLGRLYQDGTGCSSLAQITPFVNRDLSGRVSRGALFQMAKTPKCMEP